MQTLLHEMNILYFCWMSRGLLNGCYSQSYPQSPSTDQISVCLITYHACEIVCTWTLGGKCGPPASWNGCVNSTPIEHTYQHYSGAHNPITHSWTRHSRHSTRYSLHNTHTHLVAQQIGNTSRRGEPQTVPHRLNQTSAITFSATVCSVYVADTCHCMQSIRNSYD